MTMARSPAKHAAVACGLLAALFTATSAEDCLGEEGSAAPLLRRGHAHNDYYHPRPLHDALELGFNSVEADIFCVDGELLVGHDRHELRPGRTLESLYLSPLLKHVNAKGGHVHDPGVPLWLHIDIKADQATAHRRLGDELEKYKALLTPQLTDGELHGPALRVIVTGSSPRLGIVRNGIRLAGAEGRLADLESGVSKEEMPAVADNWRHHFEWDGKGPMPSDERRRLNAIVEKAHSSGRTLRLWATPETPAVWGVLIDCKVDFVSTDKLAAFAQFCHERAE